MEINYQGVNLTVFENGEIYWNGKKRNHFINADGYPCVSLKIPNVGWRAVCVHRLVASAFIPNPNHLPEVNHRDFNRANFTIENLEWITHADNIRYSQCHRDISGEHNPNFGNHKLSEIYRSDPELSKEKQGRPGLRNGRCRKISVFRDGNLVASFDYIRACMKWLQEAVSPNSKLESLRSRIRSCMKENRPYKGYTFQFEDERSNDYPVREYGSCEKPEPEAQST